MTLRGEKSERAESYKCRCICLCFDCGETSVSGDLVTELPRDASLQPRTSFPTFLATSYGFF